MCGIAGIYNYSTAREVSQERLCRMRDILSHRGPDSYGVYASEHIGLAHRRLSILDLSFNGTQPFFSANKKFIIVYNGEIFNFLELRAELEDDGFKFISNSDTEVLLNLYIRYGKNMLEKLNGMFAFAIWNKEENELFIARDRVGVKPLYYTDLNGEFAFASEQKSLFVGGIDKELNVNSFDELMGFRFIAGECTLFRNVKKLLAGHYMVISRKGVSISRWWNLSERIQLKKNQIPEDVFDWFKGTFKSSLKYRMLSDVPVGVLLSGGLDSSSIIAGLFENGFNNLTSFTVGFDDSRYNEGDLAYSVSKKFGFDYHEIRLTSEETYTHISEAAWLHDEPLIHQNDAQLLAISKYAKKYVSVLLSGEGADELMGGYVRYKPLKYLKYKNIASPVTKSLNSIFPSEPRFEKLNQFFRFKSNFLAVFYNSCSLYPQDLKEFNLNIHLDNPDSYRYKILEEAVNVYPNNPARQAMYLDQHSFLESLLIRNDRMTMGASIECRVPYLDYRLIEMIGAIENKYLLQGHKGKFLLYNSIATSLPKQVRRFKKNGFSVPWESYLKNDNGFRMELEELKSSSIFEIGILKNLDVVQILNGFKNNDRGSTVLLRQLVMIHLWFKYYYSKV